MTLYCAKLTGEDLSRYLNKIKSVGLSKAYYFRQICDLTVSAANCFSYIALPYIMAARTAGIDRMTKLRHCYPMYNIWTNNKYYISIIFYSVVQKTFFIYMTVL